MQDSLIVVGEPKIDDLLHLLPEKRKITVHPPAELIIDGRLYDTISRDKEIKEIDKHKEKIKPINILKKGIKK